MKPASFDYFKPTTLEEAAVLLSKYGEDAKILAGGQTLVPMMNFRLVAPQILVDINDVEGLNFIEQRDDAVIVNPEALVLAGIKALVAAVGVDKPRFVEAVATHHAADGVGEQPLDVFFTVGTIEGDLVVGNFGR